MSVYIQKNLIDSKKTIVLEDVTDYKIYDPNDQAHFQAFLLKSNCLMNTFKLSTSRKSKSDINVNLY